jgi:hypothetical protein
MVRWGNGAYRRRHAQQAGSPDFKILVMQIIIMIIIIIIEN